MILKKEYRRIFNSENVHWSKDTTMNYYFLKATQSCLTDMLRARGHLMLNEAYDVLGFPRTAAGAVIGWVYEEGSDFGDNFVDLGLGKCEEVGPDIPIIFNVNGNILDKLGEEP